MSKRKRMPAPPMPEKLNRYTRVAAEDTQKDLDAILSDARKTAKHAAKQRRNTAYFIDGAYGKRREVAVRNTFQTVIERYSLTEKASRLFPTAELWADLNLFFIHTLEDIDEDASILTGAALWLLDHAEDPFELQKLLSETESGEDSSLPPFFDLNHSGEAVQAVVYILKNRYAGDRSILDVNTDPGAAGGAFARLVEMMDPDELRDAVADVRTLFRQSVDGLFHAEYVLAEKYTEAVAALNAAIDRYNAQVEPMCDMLSAFVKGERTHTPPTVLRPYPANPVLAENPALKMLQSVKDMPPLMSAAPGGLPLFPHDDPAEKIARQALLLDSLSDQAGKLEEEAHEARMRLIRLLFDYVHGGFTFANAYRAHFEGADLPIPSLKIDDPYELCAGVLLLCSPTVIRQLYDGDENSSVEQDLDLPWLTGAMCGAARDISSRLPWGVRRCDEENLEFRDPPKPLAHPDWYAPDYGQGDDERRSLAQILYETTGAILPRRMDMFDDARGILRGYGIRGKNAVRMTELMTLMYEAQYRTDRLALPPHSEPAEDAGALREQVGALRGQLKKMTDEAHAQERRARKAEQSLAQERAQAKEDRRELAALREMLFLQENADASGDAVSISFPHEVKRRLVVYGGHETWRKAMKEYLTGEIRYMDKEQAIIDRSVIRNADMIWIQSNALSHRQYYAVIDEVRKTGVPVKYFLHASARKCAEQVVREDD